MILPVVGSGFVAGRGAWWDREAGGGERGGQMRASAMSSRARLSACVFRR